MVFLTINQNVDLRSTDTEKQTLLKVYLFIFTCNLFWNWDENNFKIYRVM